jgi:hypothetical protein
MPCLVQVRHPAGGNFSGKNIAVTESIQTAGKGCFQTVPMNRAAVPETEIVVGVCP